MEQLVAQAEARGVRRDGDGAARPCSSRTRPTRRRAAAAPRRRSTRCAQVFGDARRPHRDRQHQGLHRPPDGRRHRGRGRGQGAGDRHRPAGAELPARPIPELGALNLSHGGAYPVRYALRLAAGFGSQISMLLLRWTPGRRRPAPQPRRARLRLPHRRRADVDAWLARMSGARTPQLEVVQRRCGSPSGAPAAARASPEPTVPRRAGRRPSRVAPASRARPCAGVCGGGGRRRGAGAGDGGRADGLSGGLLDLDLDLEADLGIDTVKQAEVFARSARRMGSSATIAEAARLPDAQPRRGVRPRARRPAPRPRPRRPRRSPRGGG